MKPWIMGRTLDRISLPLFEAEVTEAKHPETAQKIQTLRLIGKDACNAIICRENGEIALVRQFRFGTQTLEWELPGGLIEDGEIPLDAIAREVSEETGYSLSSVQYIGRVPANPVFQNQWIYHFWGETSESSRGETTPDIGEYIQMAWFSPAIILEMIGNGTIRNPHTLSALLLLQINNQQFEKGFTLRPSTHNSAK